MAQGTAEPLRHDQTARMITSSLPRRDSLLFVYGSLRPFTGIPMARWLARHAHYTGAARVRGRLYDLGPYPGFVRTHRRGEWVIGELYSCRPAVLARLDRYEAGTASCASPRFERIAATVETARFRPRRTAWLYLYRPGVQRRPRITHGDYERELGDRSRG